MSIPRQEPSVVATLMAAATSRLGIVPTLSTFAYAPYLVARIVGTLDQISGGRAGCIVADEANGVLIDPSKVHTIDYRGRYYSSRGPLNSGPCPQGQPVIAQAGGSERGKSFASKWADTIVSHPKGVDAMKAYKADITRKLKE